jgi:superkiller protein 3
VFLGLAYDRLKEPEKAVNAYLKATEVKKDDPLAWQGLVAVYEHQAGDKILDYRDATLRLAEIYAQLYVKVPHMTSKLLTR